MLTFGKTYGYTGGRVRSSTNTGISTPVSGDFLYPFYSGGAENTTGASRIISREYLHASSPRSLAGLGNIRRRQIL